MYCTSTVQYSCYGNYYYKFRKMVNYRLAPIKSGSEMWEAAYLLYKYLKVVAPQQVQRPLCWNNTVKLKYFKSLLMNRVEGTFIFVDIESAFEAIRGEYSANEKTYKFFENLIKQGYKYIIIDGNNRFHFLHDLFDGNWLIPQGTYSYISDVSTGKIESFEVVNRQRKFENLPTKVQKAIKSRKSPVSEYSQLDLTGLADVFTNVNSGVSLNRQELRNVMDVDYADLVRELESTLMPLLTDIMEKPKLGLKGQEFIVDGLDFVLNGIVPIKDQPSVHNAINQGTKDRLYASRVDDDEFSTIRSNLKLIQDYLPKMIEDEILGQGNGRKIRRNSAIHNLLWMMCNGLDRSYESCVAAMKLSEDNYSSTKTYTVPTSKEQKSFRESCEGMNTDCMRIRDIVLSDIIKQVNLSYINV